MTPLNREEEDYSSYPVCSWPWVLTTNWYADTKYPGLYLSRDRIPSFSGTIFWFLVPFDILFDHDNNHEVHTGTRHFKIEVNLGWMKGGKTILFPFVSSVVCYFIKSWMRYMLIPSFQCHSSNSFWVSVTFWFLLGPTQGSRNWWKFSNL